MDDGAGGTPGSLRLIRGAAFCSAFDRMSIAPMLVAISEDLEVSLSRVTLAATAYFLLYGAMQPVWGMLSDRVGRVNVIRFTLVGAAAASVVSALAPTIGVLLVARACAGALFAGVIPTTLVYVGDTVPMARRQIAMTELMGATSAGIAVSTVAAGIAVVLADWRVVFAWSAIAACALAFAMRAVPEPEVPRVPSALGAVVDVLRRPWPLTVVLLALVEGTLVLGSSRSWRRRWRRRGSPRPSRAGSWASTAPRSSCGPGWCAVSPGGPRRRVSSRSARR